MKKIQQGFTLIELMIVVAIIGILAAVAIPAYQDYIVKAKLSKVTAAIDPLKLAIAAYYQEQGSYINVAGVSGTPGAGWTSLGLSTFPTPIAEAAKIGMTACTTCGADDPNIIQITLDNVRAKTIDGVILQMTPNASSTAVIWTNICNTYAAPPSGHATPTATDPIVKKYFNC